MTCIYIKALGDVDAGILSMLKAVLAERYEVEVRQLEAIREPAGAYDARRAQHGSVVMLKALMESVPNSGGKVLGVTERDLFIPMLTFVFGQAQLDGQFAVVSLARLRQEFYGLSPDRAMLEQRAVKETCHELGHTFGLAHCADKSCPMSLSTTIRQVDAKQDQFCDVCAALLRDRGLAAQGARR